MKHCSVSCNHSSEEECKKAMKGHLAACASKDLDAESCGCKTSTSATLQSGLTLWQSGLFERKLPCCTTGKCKRHNSKFFQKARYRLFALFSKIAAFFRSVDK